MSTSTSPTAIELSALVAIRDGEDPLRWAQGRTAAAGRCEKKGLCGHHHDGVRRTYFLTDAGRTAVEHAESAAETMGPPSGGSRTCSFCRRDTPADVFLIAGAGDARICSPCVTMASRLVAEREATIRREAAERRRLEHDLEHSLEAKS